MESYITENDKYFSRHARHYDLNTSLVSHLRNKLYRASGAGSEDKILDVATGTGAVAFTFANYGHRYVTGIDLSSDMLEIAKSKRSRTPVDFVRGDGSNMPFEDKSFKIASISFALHDMPNEIMLKTLKEIYRVLDENGNLIIMDYAKPEGVFWKSISYKIISAYEGIFFADFMRRDLNEDLKLCSFEIMHCEKYMAGTVQLLLCKKRMN